MTKSFNCASCSAPLEFEGTIMQKCRYCGSTVIAPPELFSSPSGPAFGDASSLTGMAGKIAEITRLIHDGKKLEAIKLFRETFGVGLAEAKDAVERMERGESVDISSVKVRTSRPMTPQDIEAVKKIGFTIGGSILATVVLSILIIVGAILAIFYFTWSTIDRSSPKVANAQPSVSPSAKPGVAPDIVEVLKFGGEGNGGGYFKDNRHVTVDGKGRIYSSDYSPFRIQVFDANGQFLNQWAAESGTNLYDLAADREGNLYVTNDKGIAKYEGETGKLLVKTENRYFNGMALTWDNKVVAVSGQTMTFFDTNLKPLQEIKDAGEKASSSSGFESIATSGDGSIYAIDNHNNEVCKFTADGKFLNRFRTDSRSSNAIAIDPKGRVFISETSNIRVLDQNGSLLRLLKTTQAFGLAFDQKGDLFVASRPYVLKYQLAF
jgi:hypothetical protein